MTLSELNRQVTMLAICDALDKCDDDLSKAAEMLDMGDWAFRRELLNWGFKPTPSGWEPPKDYLGGEVANYVYSLAFGDYKPDGE